MQKTGSRQKGGKAEKKKKHMWAWRSGNNSESSTKNWAPWCRHPCHDQGCGVRKPLLGLNTVRKGAAFKATLLLALC